MSGIKKSGLIVSAVLCGCILLFIFVSFLAFRTQPVQQFVQKKISSFIPGTIEWKNMDLSFVDTWIKINDVRLYTSDRQEVFSASRLFADLKLINVFQKEFFFPSIEIESFILNAEADQKGDFSIVKAIAGSVDSEKEKSESSGALFNIRAKKINIIDGKIKLSLQGQKIQASTNRLDIEIYNLDLQKKQGRFSLEVADTALQISQINQTLNRLRIEMELEASSLNISKGLMISGDSSLSISGKFTDILGAPSADILINANVSAGHIARTLKPELPIKGMVKADIKIKGPLDRPECSLNANAQDLSAFDQTMSVVLSGGVKDQSVFITSFKAAAKDSTARGHGKYDLKTQQFDSLISLAATDINDFTGIFGIPSKGRLIVNGKIFGNPEQPQAKLEIQADKLLVEDIALDSLTGTVYLTNRLGNIEGKIQTKADGLQIRQTHIGTLSADGIIKGTPDDLTGSVDIKGLRILSSNLHIGHAGMVLNGKGTFRDPHIQGHFDIQEMMLEKEKIAPLKLELEADKHMISAKGSFGFDVAGRYQIESRDFNAKMLVDSVQLAPYFKMAGQQELEGSVKGVITAEGSLDNLASFSAKADLYDLVLFFKKQEALRADTVRMSFSQGKLNLPETKILLFEKAIATISGQGQSLEDIRLLFDADIPMALIDPLFEQIDQAAGQLIVNAVVEGNVKAPLITGRLQLVDIGMALSYIDNNFERINGQILVDQNLIRVDQIKGFLGDGEFQANGQVKSVGMNFESGEIAFQAHQLPLNFPDLMDLTLNSRLELKGNREKSKLIGEIVLLEGRYYKDVKLDILQMAQKKRTIQPVAGKKKSSFLDNMSLDIGVTRKTPFLVENNLATLHISPDLRIAGVASNPLLSGRAQVDSGVVKFQKKEFEVQKGVIDFVSPYRIEPVIDLQAGVDIRTWTVTMAVSGPPENLDFRFSSDPSEQHADIISLLAFGKTTRELRTSQGGSNFSPGQILSGFVADSVQKNLKDISGLDSVALAVTGDGEKEDYGGQITVGKDLSQQLSVKYGMDVRSGETTQRVTTDYKILENLLMSGYQDSGGDFGGGLKYRLEFR